MARGWPSVILRTVFFLLHLWRCSHPLQKCWENAFQELPQWKYVELNANGNKVTRTSEAIPNFTSVLNLFSQGSAPFFQGTFRCSICRAQGNGLHHWCIIPAPGRRPEQFHFHLYLQVEPLHNARMACSGGISVIMHCAQLILEGSVLEAPGSLKSVCKIYKVLFQRLLDVMDQSGKKIQKIVDWDFAIFSTTPCWLQNPPVQSFIG